MRTSTAYFAGAGTVVVAIAAGISGGLVMGDVISPKSAKQATEPTRLERRMSPEPVATSVAPSAPVSYLAATQMTGVVTPVAPVPAASPAPQAAPAPPTTVAAVQPPAVAAVQPAEAKKPAAAPASPPATAVAPPVTHEQAAAPPPAAREQTVASEDDPAAKGRVADARRALEKRRAERHQHWAEKQRQRQQQEQQAAEDENAQAGVRFENEPRPEMEAQPVRVEMPLFRLFGSD